MLCDVILVLNDREYLTHSVVLSFYSDTFRRRLINRRSSSSEFVVCVRLDSATTSEITLQQVLGYFYERRPRIAELDLKSIGSLIDFGRQYSVKNLLNDCEEFLLSLINEGNHENNDTRRRCLIGLTIASEHNMSRAFRKLLNTIALNYKHFLMMQPGEDKATKECCSIRLKSSLILNLFRKIKSIHFESMTSEEVVLLLERLTSMSDDLNPDDYHHHYRQHQHQQQQLSRLLMINELIYFSNHNDYLNDSKFV